MVIFHSYVKLLEGILYKHIACQMHIDIETAIPLTHRHSMLLKFRHWMGWPFALLTPSVMGQNPQSPKNYCKSPSTSINIPSGKRLQFANWKITIFNRKIHYKWPFSIAMLNYQRVSFHWSQQITKNSDCSANYVGSNSCLWGAEWTWPRGWKWEVCYRFDLESIDIHSVRLFLLSSLKSLTLFICLAGFDQSTNNQRV